MLRERPSKQSRRGVCLSFLTDCKSAKGPSRGDQIPIVRNNRKRFRPPCLIPASDPLTSELTQGMMRHITPLPPRHATKKVRKDHLLNAPNHPAYPWFESRCLTRKLKLRICTRMLRWWTRPPLRAMHLSAHNVSAGVLAYDCLRLHK